MATAALRRVLLDSTAWLPRDNGQPKFDKTLVIPLAIGGLIVVVVFWIGLCYRRQLLRRRQRELMVESPASFSLPVYEAYAQHSPSSERCHTLSLGARPLGLDETYRVPPKSDEVESAGILPRLLESPELTDRRFPFQRLKFKATLSSGAHGEVWLGLYRGHQVAVKQLLRTNELSRKDVQDFADEILLTATLSHPNIVAFVGVAGSNVDTLALVLEFCPMGDLRRFLRESGRLLSWNRDKIRMALGVAKALRYLHSQEPPIIHRDLKSMNVLLTETLETKVGDFGVSRACNGGFPMTAGVGTPYWIAPEVLRGKRYSEQADIYSFGVVLSELDTCRTPFADVVTAEGKKPKPVQILRWVLDGKLSPAFSQDCPRWIRCVSSTTQTCAPRRPSSRRCCRWMHASEFILYRRDTMI